MLTLNEERNIGALPRIRRRLRRMPSCSTPARSDATLRIAARLGAARPRSIQFTSFGQQRKLGARHICRCSMSWVLHLDADERMTPALAREIAAVIAADTGKACGLSHPRAHAAARPTGCVRAGSIRDIQARLVHRARMRFIDHGHGQREQSNLPFGTLANPYDHLAFSHGLRALATQTWPAYVEGSRADSGDNRGR